MNAYTYTLVMALVLFSTACFTTDYILNCLVSREMHKRQLKYTLNTLPLVTVTFCSQILAQPHHCNPYRVIGGGGGGVR